MKALFGGSFDPFHEGHLSVLKFLENRFSDIYLIPSNQNPLKEKCHASPKDRYEMIKRGLFEISNPRFHVLDWEVMAEAPSFTYVTVQRWCESNPLPPTLVIGNEVFAMFPKWKEPKKICEKSHILVLTREPKRATNVEDVLIEIGLEITRKDGEKIYHSGGLSVEMVKINALPYSSSSIRKEIFNKWQKNDLMQLTRGIQRSVWLYIKENSLYSVY